MPVLAAGAGAFGCADATLDDGCAVVVDALLALTPPSPTPMARAAAPPNIAIPVLVCAFINLSSRLGVLLSPMCICYRQLYIYATIATRESSPTFNPPLGRRCAGRRPDCYAETVTRA